MGIFSRLLKKSVDKKQNVTVEKHFAKSESPRSSEQEKRPELDLVSDITRKFQNMLKGTSEIINEHVPESGKMRDIIIMFNTVGGFVKEWRLTISGRPDAESTVRVLSLSALFPDDDRYVRPMSGYMTSQYIFTGTKQELLDYLTLPECAENIIHIAIRLDESVKNHD